MSVLAQRFLFSTLLLGGTLGLLWIDHLTEAIYGFLTLEVVFGVVGWWEFARLCSLARPAQVIGGVVILAGLSASWVILGADNPWEWPPACLVFTPLLFPAVLFPFALRRTPSRAQFHEVALGTFGTVYLLLPLIACLWLRSLPHGASWVLLMILVVKGNDIGAYLVGRKLGRTPLSPVSPKKTVEGSLGGLVLGILVALAFVWIPAATFSAVWEAILVGVLAGVAGQLGDLAESYLKRSMEVKDSGALVPTFGGALDILDSLLFGAPVVLALAVGIGT